MGGAGNVCIAGENTLDVRRGVIVFVPGVMGSRLHFSSNSAFIPDRAWDPDSVPAMAQWAGTPAGTMRDWLRVDGDATVSLIETPPVPASERGWGRGWASRTDISLTSDQVRRRFGTVALSSYGSFLTRLDERIANGDFGSGWNLSLYAYGYDWRQPIEELGRTLAADLAGGTGGTGVFGTEGLIRREQADWCILITHSMGGLVARAALKQSPQLQQKILGVLHGVQPATGATVFYRRCITGAAHPWDGDGGFRRIIGSDGPAFATVVSGLPGPVNLFPSQRLAADLATRGASILTWTRFEESRATVHAAARTIYQHAEGDERAQPPGIVRSDVPADVRDDLRLRLRQTAAFHRSISADGREAGPPWMLEGRTWAFFGDGLPTDSTMHFDLPPQTVQTEVLGGPYGPAEVMFYGVDPATNRRVYFREREDLQFRGYNPHHGQGLGRPAGRSADGDTTVPSYSGAALFGIDAAASISDLTVEPGAVRQFVARGVEHEPAFQDSNVVEFTNRWLVHVLSTACRQGN